VGAAANPDAPARCIGTSSWIPRREGQRGNVGEVATVVEASEDAAVRGAAVGAAVVAVVAAVGGGVFFAAVAAVVAAVAEV